jgi:hypothetical protein
MRLLIDLIIEKALPLEDGLLPEGIRQQKVLAAWRDIATAADVELGRVRTQLGVQGAPGQPDRGSRGRSSGREKGR